MDENPEQVKRIIKKSGAHGSRHFFDREVEVLTLERDVKAGGKKHEFWLVRIPGQGGYAGIEIPVAIPNPGLGILQQSIRPGVYEYEPKKDYIHKWHRSDATIDGISPSRWSEDKVRVGDLDGVTMLLEMTTPVGLEQN